MSRCPWSVFAPVLVLAACEPAVVSDPPSATSYIYAWTADADGADEDFLAVIGADPDGPMYGHVVATVPTGRTGTGPHHTEHVSATDGVLIANGFGGGITFRFDTSDPAAPRLAGSFDGLGGLTFPHSFERLPNGHILATFQADDTEARGPGGLAEFTPAGELVRWSSAAPNDVDDPIRPYSLTILPDLDRVVSTSADMFGESQSRAVQVWRLSDLSLLNTLLLPHGDRGSEGWLVGEPRVLTDGETVLIGTFSCGLYRLDGLATETPEVALVHTFPFNGTPECALSARVRDFWIQTVPSIGGLISLDVSDPDDPVEVDRLELGDGMWPHWIAPDPDTDSRLVVTGYEDLRHRLLLVRLDPETGALELDTTFGDVDMDPPGADLGPVEWPHGETGAGVPHGAVFSRPIR